jgi:ribosomal protein S18 acetylase RimI-like enzyme
MIETATTSDFDAISALNVVAYEQFAGKGLARKLTEACITRAKQDGVVSIALFTSEIMVTAHHLYKDLGFQSDSKLPLRYGIRYRRFVLPLAVMFYQMPRPYKVQRFKQKICQNQWHFCWDNIY